MYPRSNPRKVFLKTNTSTDSRFRVDSVYDSVYGTSDIQQTWTTACRGKHGGKLLSRLHPPQDLQLTNAFSITLTAGASITAICARHQPSPSHWQWVPPSRPSAFCARLRPSPSRRQWCHHHGQASSDRINMQVIILCAHAAYMIQLFHN